MALSDFLAMYVHLTVGSNSVRLESSPFFNSGISTSGGDSLASESVKLKIKDLVDAEDPKKPLSDQKIVDALKKDGIIRETELALCHQKVQPC